MALPVILLYTLKAFLNEKKLNIDCWSRLKVVESNILECRLEYTMRCYNYHDLKTIVLDSDVEFLKNAQIYLFLQTLQIRCTHQLKIVI